MSQILRTHAYSNIGKARTDKMKMENMKKVCGKHIEEHGIRRKTPVPATRISCFSRENMNK